MLFHIIVWVITGLIAGALARLLVPGKDPMSLGMTIVLGILGSFVGGFIASLIWRTEGQGLLHPGGLVLSVVGAIILLVLWHRLRPRSPVT